MRIANLGLRFAVELAALASLAYWGAGATGSGVANLAIAILSPLAAATVWGLWSAPKASRRLSGRPLATLELALLVICCALLALAGAVIAAAVLFAIALANALYLRHLQPAPG